MKVVIDSYGLLRAIGEHRETFAAIDTLVKKHAVALLTAQLKHKSLNLAHYRAIVAAIGTEAFELFLDTADDKLMRTIAKKLDPHAATTRTDDSDDLRPHLVGLANGRIEPSTKPRKAPQGTKKSAGPSSEGSGATEPHAIATKPPGRR